GAAEYGLWLLAFGVEGMDGLRASAAEYPEYADVDGLTSRLLDRGALVRCTDEQLPDVFARHRLVAQGSGLGAEPDEPGLYTVADVDGRPRVKVGLSGYRVWAMSWPLSLWMLCEDLSDDAGRPPAELARQLATDLVLLLRGRAALLDRWP